MMRLESSLYSFWFQLLNMIFTKSLLMCKVQCLYLLCLQDGLFLVPIFPPVLQVVVGVCAMEKKTLSKPMKEILTRLEEFEYIKTCIFTEKVILEV